MSARTYARRCRHTHDALHDSIARIPAADRPAAIDAAARRYSLQAGVIEGAAFVLLIAVFVFWWVAT